MGSAAADDIVQPKGMMREAVSAVYALDDTLAAGGAAAATQSPSPSTNAKPVAVSPERARITPMDGRLQQRPDPGSTAP